MNASLPLDLPAMASPGTTGQRRAQSAGAGKSDFEKDALNRYDTTDPHPVAMLLPHLEPATAFIEPCAGKRDLVRQLQAAGHICIDAFDIAPRADHIRQQDARTWVNYPDGRHLKIISNPPFDWAILRDLLENWRDQVAASWVLLPASFMHTHIQGRDRAMARCRRIVSIGRVWWVADTDDKSTKDFCWYEFGPIATPGTPPLFYSRAWQKVG